MSEEQEKHIKGLTSEYSAMPPEERLAHLHATATAVVFYHTRDGAKVAGVKPLAMEYLSISLTELLKHTQAVCAATLQAQEPV